MVFIWVAACHEMTESYQQMELVQKIKAHSSAVCDAMHPDIGTHSLCIIRRMPVSKIEKKYSIYFYYIIAANSQTFF